MRKGIKFSLTVAILLLAAGLSMMIGCSKKAEDVAVSPKEINFVTDYATALQTAQEKHQRILIDFYTDWCIWCKRLDSFTYSDSAVIEMSKAMVFAKINAEVDTLTAQKYVIPGYPTIVIAESDGTEIERIGGFLPAADFIKTVNDYLNDVGTLADYLRMADTNATVEINAIIGEKYESRGMYDMAMQYYQKVIDADPDNAQGKTPEAMLSVGGILLRDKRYDDAMATFKNVIKKFSGTDSAIDGELWLGYALRKKGDTSGAIKHYETFLKNYPNFEDSTRIKETIEKLKNPPPPEQG